MHDSQLRWLGPEKGVMHMAIGAVVNAVWDLAAKRAGVPLWRLLSDLTPEQIVDLVDFRYLTDALTPAEALEILRAAKAGRSEREALLRERGYPAYTTTPGWLGYDDAKLVRLCHEAVAEGFTQIKLKVGADLDDDIRRMRLAREAVGPDIRIAIDANQRWDVAEAIRWVEALAPYDVWWVEEPTSPDDILGHAAIAKAIAPIRVATGEHVQNRVVFKQMLQAGALSVLQIDAARVGGSERERRDPAAGGEVRRTGVSARRRGRAVRTGPAPVDVRLRRGERVAGGPGDRVRRPPARALPGPGGDPGRAVRGAGAARVRRRDGC